MSEISSWLPQMIWIGMVALTGLSVYNNGRSHEMRNFVVGMVIINAVLWWGGFFG